MIATMPKPERVPHLIVADDEVFTSMALERFLSRNGYRVSAVPDGQRALEVHRADPADLLITDLRMPKLPGAELVRRARAETPDLPVVVSTGYVASDADVPPDGRTVLLNKPVDPMELLDVVRDLLASR